MEKSQVNYNESFEKGKLIDSLRKREAKEKDALDKKIDEFMSHKKKIPPPEVKHDKSNAFNQDITIQNFTLIVGGKPLLEGATLKLVRGKKYGLIGRNGIGKTCLINAISKGEIEKFPKGIHTL